MRQVSLPILASHVFQRNALPSVDGVAGAHDKGLGETSLGIEVELIAARQNALSHIASDEHPFLYLPLDLSDVKDVAIRLQSPGLRPGSRLNPTCLSLDGEPGKRNRQIRAIHADLGI